MKKELNKILYDTISDLQKLKFDGKKNYIKFYLYRIKVLKKIKSMKNSIKKILDVEEYTAYDIHNFILFINSANVLDLFKSNDNEVSFICPKPEYISNPSNPSTSRLYAKTKTSDGGLFEVAFIPVLYLNETEIRIEWVITDTEDGLIISSKNYHSTLKCIKIKPNDIVKSDKDILENGSYYLLKELFNKCIGIICSELEMRYIYDKK